MDNYMLKALDRYFNTLKVTGFLKRHLWGTLFLAVSVFNIYKVFCNRATKSDVKLFDKTIKELTRNNRLFDYNQIPDLMYGSQGGSLITIIDNDIMIASNGSTLVPIAQNTQKFTDFEVRTDIQADNFMVGYDSSDNTEIRVNVRDLGIYWEED